MDVIVLMARLFLRLSNSLASLMIPALFDYNSAEKMYKETHKHLHGKYESAYHIMKTHI